MYLLVDGAVEVRRLDDAMGRPPEVRELRSGEVFGLLSLLDHMPAVATCTALEPVTAAALERPAFEALFSSAPPIGHHIQYMVAIQLARDLQERNKGLRALLAQRATARA
jgi:CRP-like cAMP-binding protein